MFRIFISLHHLSITVLENHALVVYEDIHLNVILKCTFYREENYAISRTPSVILRLMCHSKSALQEKAKKMKGKVVWQLGNPSPSVSLLKTGHRPLQHISNLEIWESLKWWTEGMFQGLRTLLEFCKWTVCRDVFKDSASIKAFRERDRERMH